MSAFKNLIPLAALFVLLTISAGLEAQMVVGTWLRTPTKTAPGVMTMTVEPCCGSGYKLTYRFTVGEQAMVMTVESPFDGSEVPVLVGGEESAETMAIKRVDDHHSMTVVKMNGEEFGTSKAALSADGRTLTVLNDYTRAAGGNPIGKFTETWTKQ
jgi:hypothetical protein